jgi:hypothetical protein
LYGEAVLFNVTLCYAYSHHVLEAICVSVCAGVEISAFMGGVCFIGVCVAIFVCVCDRGGGSGGETESVCLCVCVRARLTVRV